MPKTIYKFPLSLTDVQNVSVQKGAEILTVQLQRNTPCLWALVDPQAEKETRTIFIAGTGSLLNEDLTYRHVGTFQMAGGNLVFHAFEVLQ